MKRILFVLGLLGLGGSVFAQTLKIQAGTSLSSLDWKISSWDAGYTKSLVKFSGSIGMDYLDKKYYNLSTNIGFLTKGGRGKTDLTNANGIATGQQVSKVAKLNYLSLNTCVDLKYPVGKTMVPYLSVGPRVDYLLSHSAEFDGLETNNISYGLLVGAGIKFNIAKVQLGVRSDYFVNFNNIAKWSAQGSSLGGKISDNTMLFSVTLGYKL